MTTIRGSAPRRGVATLATIAFVVVWLVTSLPTLAQSSGEPPEAAATGQTAVPTDTPPESTEAPSVSEPTVGVTEQPSVPPVAATDPASRTPPTSGSSSTLTSPATQDAGTAGEGVQFETTPTLTAPTPTADVPFQAAAVDGTGVRVKVTLNDNFGPPIKGACFSLLVGVLRMWQAGGCTDATGVVLLVPFGPDTGPSTLWSSDPLGYHILEDQIPVSVIPGTITDYVVNAIAVPPTDLVFHALDKATAQPVGGACWSIYSTVNSLQGELVAGPLCDDDSDGTVNANGTPSGPFCYRVTAPSGYVLLGQAGICVVSSTTNAEVTRWMSPAGSEEDPGAGVLSITAVTSWSQPLEGACVTLQQEAVGGSLVNIASACSGGDGKIEFTGLQDGNYTINGAPVPRYYGIFTVSTSIQAPTGTSLRIVVESIQFAKFRFEANLASTDTLLGGACWSYTNDDHGRPGIYRVAGPVCDTDGDGVVEIESLPRGRFCFVATPPDGFYRPREDYFACVDVIAGGSWKVGFIPVPVKTTPTVTATQTPSNTPTPPPTATPAPNEPKGNVTVRNCQQTKLQGIYRSYDLCMAAPAGVKFAVLQHDVQVGTATTNASGTLSVDLPERAAYRLSYLEGNSGFAPGPGEEARKRYDALEPFTFLTDPLITEWTMTVKVISNSYWNRGTPLGGACYRIVDKDGNQLLPEVCDTDQDGTVTVGTLPAPEDLTRSPYFAEMTVAPNGFTTILATRPGSTSVGDPGAWSTTFLYDPTSVTIRTVDADGNLLSGFGYTQYKTGDGLAGLTYDNSDGLDDGLTHFSQLAPGPNQHFRAAYPRAGWVTDQLEQVVTLGPEPELVLTFVARPYGADRNDRADLKFLFKWRSGENFDNSYMVCLTLSPNSGIPNDREVCPDRPGYAAIFRNLPTGAYTATLHFSILWGNYCPVDNPQPAVTIGTSDLGTTVTHTIVFKCDKPTFSGGSCFVFEDPDTSVRNVNIYYGDLTDFDSGDLLARGFELSESISDSAADALLQADGLDASRINPDSLGPWIQGYASSVDWAAQPDWDANAYRALTEGFTAIDSHAVIGPRTLVASKRLNVGLSSAIYFLYPGDPLLAKYPQCSADDTLFVFTTSYATFNIYEMDATTGPPAPSPTVKPWPSPAAICQSSAARGLTIAYGEIVDPETGATVYRGLQLSDRIPQEIADAIKAGDAPAIVKALVDDWVDPDLDAGEWPFEPASDSDPEASLRADLLDQGYSIDLPGDGKQSNGAFSANVYRWVNNANLPEGCFVASELGDLYPIQQHTTASVTFVRLSATVMGAGGGTATATATPTPARTPSPVSTPEPAATNGPVTALPHTGTAAGGRGEGGGLSLLLAILTALLVAMAAIGRRRANG